MGHPTRRYVQNRTYFVTNRLAEGLPFVPNKYVNALLWGVMARAKCRCPSINICHWTFMGNHYHGMIIPKGDPADVKDFMHYVDSEIAKIVVRMLGLRNVKVWAQRYNPVEILDYQAAIQQVSYIYLNPVEANLVPLAKSWVGVNTWSAMFGETSAKHKWVRPGAVEKLPNRPFNKASINRLMDEIEELNSAEFAIQFDPFIFKDCFESSKHLSDEEVKSDILELISAGEKQCRKRRKQAPCAELKQLVFQNPHKHYKPKKFGIRVFCISTNVELRKEFIAMYKEFVAKCQCVWECWKKGDFSVDYPPGAFRPPRPPKASIVFGFT